MIGVVARGLVSPFGEGDAALGPLVVGEPAASCVTRDQELVEAGFAKPFVARAACSSFEDAAATSFEGAVATSFDGAADRATVLLERALEGCACELDEALPGWRGLRVGAAIGTSSGGMRSFERLLDAASAPSVAGALAATYIGPLVHAARPTAFEPVSLVLGACASSTLAIGVARAWLQEDRCDVALCGGFDAVSVFVAAGFESLRATAGARGPRPFREGRDGLALGEGAAVLALVREPEARRSARVYGWIAGFGASCDATHLTAPEPGGGGLARAATAAIAEAGGLAIDLVSAHGTATVQNDKAEAAAIVATLGPDASRVPVHSLKGAIGHTLGAAGALESLAALRAIERGVAPASFGEGAAVEAGLRVLDRAERVPARTALKLSSAFGGANAALVVSADPGPRRAPRADDVVLSRAVAVTLADVDVARLAAQTGYGADRIARADELVRLAMAAIAALAAAGGAEAIRGSGVLVGHGLATVETNARFWSRIRASGVSRAEPRRFPYTTPNAAAGECAIAFGLTGPAFAVGGGPHGGVEALGVAADLVRAGVAERVVVVAADEVGEASRRIAPASAAEAGGAVALLVSAARRAPGPWARAARLVSCTLRLEASATLPPALGALTAHRALAPLVSGTPDRIAAEVPWGGRAEAVLQWI
ncbi:MAG: 3-oxoacyl-ACP synthase [Labilithrix sp.]|nr:3-oxoacyl-ACP synthase [Labilithrix sp.]